MAIRARITGIGSHLPARVMTNADLEKLCDTSDEWIYKRSGIRERRIAADDEGALDLALPAAMGALEDAGLAPEDMDAVIVCTVTPHQIMPATANLLQGKIGAGNAASWDINTACTGFIAGLQTANGLIAAGTYKRILLVGSEKTSYLMTWERRDTSVLFGDGAGAVILEPDDSGRGILRSTLGTDGANAEVLHVPSGGSRYKITPEFAANGAYYVYMDGRKLYERAVRGMVQVSEELLDAEGITPEDVALVVPHQANARIIEAVAERLNFPMDKIVMNIERVGNTVAASIPIALHEAQLAGRLHEGDYVLLVAFGGGLSWGGALCRW